MENLVGDTIPSEAEVAKLERDLEALTERVRKFAIELDNDQRRTIAKPRTGWVPITAEIARLAKDHDIRIPGYSVDDMLADRTLAERIGPLVKKANTLAQLLDDTLLEAQGECWTATGAFYSVLLRASEGAPPLRDALKTAIDFWALGKRKKPAAVAKT